MSNLAFKAYWKLEGWIAPGLRYAQYDYEFALSELVHEGCEWLDVGCGPSILPEWRHGEERDLVRRARRIVGIDVDKGGLVRNQSVRRVLGDVSNLPFPDGRFDLVSANMVLEHLPEPAAQLREVWRMLKPGGAFIFITPNVRSYFVILSRMLSNRAKKLAVRLLEGRAGEDHFPTFYRANSAEDIRAVAEEIGFDVPDIRYVCTTAICAKILPLAAIELMWIRLLLKERMRRYRQDLICVLRKPRDSRAVRGAQSAAFDDVEVTNLS
jgi:ubiquinone/menaquinone biosynthesis C-methylase UbiE